MKNRKSYKDKIICFDFDGTITKIDIYPEIDNDNVNNNIVSLINKLYYDGYKILINSARDTIYYSDIYQYLLVNDIKYHEIHLKCKPTADVYIDDKGLFQNIDFLEAYIESVFYDVDDYINLVANNELKSSFSKNISNVPENPDYQEIIDINFKIILPITGGMDSVTLWSMLEESGNEYLPYYIDLGQSYAKKELSVIREILEKDPVIIKKDVNFKKFKHILTGRNVFIILLLAEEFKKNNWWGEIWFGNLQGESPIIGGDKSRKFFNDMNAFLVNHGYNVRIVNPLIGLNKYDQVAYWKNRDIELFKNTSSCFSEYDRNCGKCQSCFRKHLAFLYNDIDISDIFTDIQFDDHIEKYKIVMKDALDRNDFSHYSKSRIIKTLETISKIK